MGPEVYYRSITSKSFTNFCALFSFQMTPSLGGPTGLFSKALRDAGKKISVSSLKGMGLRDDR